jgi:hypothetical protein
MQEHLALVVQVVQALLIHIQVVQLLMQQVEMVKVELLPAHQQMQLLTLAMVAWAEKQTPQVVMVVQA